jgi:hypothetical protein
MTPGGLRDNFNKIYPSLVSQVLSDINQDMDEIKTEAMRNEFSGICEHLVIINNIIGFLIDKKLNPLKIIDKK